MDTQSNIDAPLVTKKPMSTERLHALAAARLKATEVRRARAAAKAESKELERLEREVQRQNLAKRRQELEAKLGDLAQGGHRPNPPNSLAGADSTQAKLGDALRRGQHREPSASPKPSSTQADPSSSDGEFGDIPEPPPVDVKRAYRAKVQQMKEDLVFRSIFG